MAKPAAASGAWRRSNGHPAHLTQRKDAGVAMPTVGHAGFATGANPGNFDMNAVMPFFERIDHLFPEIAT